jgi:hypothetical protein
LKLKLVFILLGDEDDRDKPVPDVMRLPKEGKLLSYEMLIICYAAVTLSNVFEVKRLHSLKCVVSGGHV